MEGGGFKWFLLMNIAQCVRALMTLEKARISDELLIKRLFFSNRKLWRPPAADIILEQTLLGIDSFYMVSKFLCVLKNLVFYVVVFVYVCVMIKYIISEAFFLFGTLQKPLCWSQFEC